MVGRKKSNKDDRTIIAAFLAFFTFVSVMGFLTNVYVLLLLLFPVYAFYHDLKVSEKIRFKALFDSLLLAGFFVVMLGAAPLIAHYTTKPHSGFKELALFTMLIGACISLLGLIYRVAFRK